MYFVGQNQRKMISENKKGGVLMYSKVNIQAFKIALLEKGYSYNEFSRKTGISTVTIMRMIQGKNKTNPKNAKKIADALDKPVTELFNIE